MDPPFDQELVLCGEFLSLKDPLLALEGAGGELRLKETVNGVPAVHVNVADNRNDRNLDEVVKDVDSRQEERETKLLPEEIPITVYQSGGRVSLLEVKKGLGRQARRVSEVLAAVVDEEALMCSEFLSLKALVTPVTLEGVDSDCEGSDTVGLRVQEASKPQVQESTEVLTADEANIDQKTLFWEFLTCEDEDQEPTKEEVSRSVEVEVQNIPDAFPAAQANTTQKTARAITAQKTDQADTDQKTPLWEFLSCQGQNPFLEGAEVQALETFERQNFIEKIMQWEFLTCATKDQVLEVQVQEAGKGQVKEITDIVPSDQAIVANKNPFWNFLKCENAVDTQLSEVEQTALWEFMTCKNHVQEMMECQLPENAECQLPGEETTGIVRADQVDISENKLLFQFLTCNDLVLPARVEGEVGGEPLLQKDPPSADQFDAVKTKAADNGEESHITITKGEVEVALVEPVVAADLPKPRKVSVTTTEIRRWAENKDKRQIKAVYRQFGVNPKAVIRMEGHIAIPNPKEEDHVIIKVEASTVSITDCLLRRGVSFDMFAQDELPATPGCDVVGYIVKLGPKATSHMNDFTYGDRVAALVRTGGNARYISVSASDLVRVPRSCDSVEAACMVSIFSTAYTSLKEISIDTPTFSLEGKKVLVVGGMDPVGQALIQMLIKARADPVFVTAPEYHHPYIRSVLGAYPLPEKAVEWTPYVNEKMDFVFDGECEDSMKASRSALAPDGHLVCFGTRSVLKEKEVSAFGAPLYAIYNKWNAESKPKTTTIDIWDGFQKDRVTAKRHLTALFQLLKGKKIKPRIACRISLAEVADAQAKLENGEFNGAVVCLPWKRTPPRPEENSRDRNPVGRNVGGW